MNFPSIVVTHHSGICKKHWWRNLLFIHNYFGFENMCLTHTHVRIRIRYSLKKTLLKYDVLQHVGIDSQLFLVAPFFIYLIWKWPKKGLITVVGLALLSTAARFYVTFTRHLSNYVYFGTRYAQVYHHFLVF